MNDEAVLKEHKLSQRMNENYGHLTSCQKCRGKGMIYKCDAKGYHSAIHCECNPRPVEDREG